MDPVVARYRHRVGARCEEFVEESPLRRLQAAHAGAKRSCINDQVGHATPPEERGEVPRRRRAGKDLFEGVSLENKVRLPPRVQAQCRGINAAKPRQKGGCQI